MEINGDQIHLKTKSQIDIKHADQNTQIKYGDQAKVAKLQRSNKIK